MPKKKEFFPEIVRCKVVDLIPYARNTKQHPESQISEIMASIQEFKFINPIVIADNVIIAGHGRLEAAKRLKLDEVPCIDVSHLSEGQQKAYRITDNRLPEKAPWDNELLAVELEELSGLPDLNVEITGFDKEAIADMILANDQEEGDGPGLGNPVIAYEIVFEDVNQQDRWYSFLRYLKRHIEGETTAERLDTFLDNTIGEDLD